MGLLDWLTGGGVRPKPEVQDEVLGTLIWSDDEDGWMGTASGLNFSLGYGKGEAPAESLVAYARELLVTPEWLIQELEAAKVRQRDEFRGHYEAELQELRYELVAIYQHKGNNRVIASLGPGRDYRAWRIEFSGRKCKGIGFDS